MRTIEFCVNRTLFNTRELVHSVVGNQHIPPHVGHHFKHDGLRYKVMGIEHEYPESREGNHKVVVDLETDM